MLLFGKVIWAFKPVCLLEVLSQWLLLFCWLPWSVRALSVCVTEAVGVCSCLFPDWNEITRKMKWLLTPLNKNFVHFVSHSDRTSTVFRWGSEIVGGRRCFKIFSLLLLSITLEVVLCLVCSVFFINQTSWFLGLKRFESLILLSKSTLNCDFTAELCGLAVMSMLFMCSWRMLWLSVDPFTGPDEGSSVFQDRMKWP